MIDRRVGLGDLHLDVVIHTLEIRDAFSFAKWRAVALAINRPKNANAPALAVLLSELQQPLADLGTLAIVTLPPADFAPVRASSASVEASQCALQTPAV